jgi:hypothetical protein
MSGKAQMISPDLYPQMLPRGQAARLSQVLRSADAAAMADNILQQSAAPLREAVLTHVAEMEAAGHDHALVSEKAHEIKGFADTAGLPAAARIAAGLCRYLERSEMARIPTDAAVVALHVSAIARAARSPDLEAQAGAAVADELALLAERKLAEAEKRA